MSIFTKKGADAIASASNEGGSGAESALVTFKSGTTYKVGVKSIDDVAEYYGYSIYKKVNTFVPKNPADRNAKGFITGNPTVWDRAADTLYEDAKKAKDSGASEDAVKKITDEAYLYRGKKRFLRAFYDLTSGKDIVVDLSPKQETTLNAVIAKYAKKLGTLAFELTKTGTSTNAVVALSPIIDMDTDLTDAERANFAKLSETPFDMSTLESCLYIADEAEQVKNLVIAGFDIGRLGLTYGGNSEAGDSGSSVETGSADAVPITDADAPPDDPSVNF